MFQVSPEQYIEKGHPQRKIHAINSVVCLYFSEKTILETLPGLFRTPALAVSEPTARMLAPGLPWSPPFGRWRTYLSCSSIENGEGCSEGV